MRILVYGLNYAPEIVGVGKYTSELCEWLAERGHDVRVVCAVPYYPDWRVEQKYRRRLYTTEQIRGVTVFRSRLYVPRKPRASKRLVHLLSFALLSVPQVFRSWKWRPQVVISVEPTLFCSPAASLAAWLFGAVSVLHVQDFEVDAMEGLGMERFHWVSRFAGALERWLMHRFDAVSAISHCMVARAEHKLKNARPVWFFPNWVDTEFVNPAVSGDGLRRRWAIPATAKTVLYSGNMGRKQGLEELLDAATALRDEKDVQFLLVGAGAVRGELEATARQRALTNVRFFPLVPYDQLPELMALADVHVVIQKRGAADAVLPSKLTTIFTAGGNALITADKDTELGRLCEKHPGIARRVEPEEDAQFIAALRDMLAEIDPAKRQHNTVARAYAEEHLKKEQVLRSFESQVAALCAERAAVAAG